MPLPPLRSGGGTQPLEQTAAQPASRSGSSMLFPRHYLAQRSISPNGSRPASRAATTSPASYYSRNGTPSGADSGKTYLIPSDRAVTPIVSGSAKNSNHHQHRPLDLDDAPADTLGEGAAFARLPKPLKVGALTGEHHLADALQLVLTIMGRMRHEGQTLTEEDRTLIKQVGRTEALFSVPLRSYNNVGGLSQSGSPSHGRQESLSLGRQDSMGSLGASYNRTSLNAPPSPSPLGSPKPGESPVESSLDRSLNARPNSGARTGMLLAKLRGVSSSSAVYKKLVESNSSLEHMSEFSIAVASTLTTEGASDLLKRQLDRQGLEVEVYVVEPVQGVLYKAGAPRAGESLTSPPPPPESPSRRRTSVAATLNETDHRLVRALQGKEYFVSNGLGYFPIRMDDQPLGVIEIADAPRVVGSDSKKQQAMEATVGIAALAFRNVRLIESVKWQKEKAEAMLKMANQLSRDNLREEVLVGSIIETARELTESDRCSVFLVKGEQLQAYFGDGKAVRMKLNTGIAGHVATTGETVNIKDAYADKRFNPAVDKATGYRTKTILCMPVRYEGTIVAVAQLVNKLPESDKFGSYDREFTARDQELFVTFSTFIGVCLRNCRVNDELTKEKRKSEMVLDCVTSLSDSDIRDVDDVTSKVMHGAKQLLNADRATLFLIDKEHSELYSNFADSTGGKEIRFPSGTGIAGTVAMSGQAENIKDAYDDERFNQNIDKQLGYRTRSILCEPIMCRGELLAVAQLVNKIDDFDADEPTTTTFDEVDQQTFRTFALFAGISLSNAALLDFAVKSGQEAMSLSNFDGSPKTRPGSPKRDAISKVEFNAVVDLDLPQWATDTAGSKEFDLFKLREDHGVSHAQNVAVRFITDLIYSTGLPEKFGCEKRTIYNFVIHCKKRYRRVPYHNFFHAVDACQTIHTFLFEGMAKTKINELEQFVLLITALAHDLDHMGVNNSFHLKTDSPLGMLSSATGANSVLEVHHCNVAIEILDDPEANVFGGLPAQEKAHAYRTMIDTILATDMARHGELSTAWTNLAEAGFSTDDPEHRKLACQMIMKAADISNVTKPFQVSRLWALCVTEEFYQQGDKEKQQGVEVLPMFDRQKAGELAKGQIGFIQFIAKNFFKVLTALLPDMEWVNENIESNTRSWSAVSETRRSSLTRLGLNDDGSVLVLQKKELGSGAEISEKNSKESTTNNTPRGRLTPLAVADRSSNQTPTDKPFA